MEEVKSFLENPEKNLFLFELKSVEDEKLTLSIDNSFEFSIKDLKVSTSEDFLEEWSEKCNKHNAKSLSELLKICTKEYGIVMDVEDKDSPLYKGQDVFELENDNNDIKFVSRIRINTEEFNTDLLLNVFAFLTPENTLRLSRVCKSWKKLVQTDSLWKDYCKKEGIVELFEGVNSFYQLYVALPWDHYCYLSIETPGCGLQLQKPCDPTEFTLEFWMIETQMTSVYGIPFLNSDNYWGSGFGMWSTGESSYAFYVNSWSGTSQNQYIQMRFLNKWNHYAIVVSKTNNYFYINGELIHSQDSPTYTNFNTSSNFTIGYGDYAGTLYGIVGGMSEIRMYDHPRSENEIKKNYKRVPMGNKGLLFNYRFQKELKELKDGSIIEDLSGNGLNAKVVGQGCSVKSFKK